MNYQFPEIRHIDDVRPAITGRNEFIIAEREHYDVINYVVAMADTFDMTDPDDIMGAIRRECRGLIFDKSGNLISRPFHKFFNVGERSETQMANLDMSASHVIMEKMDGSMVRPLIINGEVFLGTKMGVTDIGLDATKLLNNVQKNWLRSMVEINKTPIMEYISPANKIVIQYKEANLVILGVRDNLTGQYELPMYAPFDIVPTYGSLEGNIEEYISRARQLQGREGDIIRFADGHMLKIKNDWYVRIHKTKDMIRTERHILNIIINEEMDDLLPILDEDDTNTVKQYEKRFNAALGNVLGRLEGLVTIAKTLHGYDKKAIALEFAPNLIFKQDARFIFSVIDGKELRPLVLDHVAKSVSKTANYEQLAEWMGLEYKNSDSDIMEG